MELNLFGAQAQRQAEENERKRKEAEAVAQPASPPEPVAPPVMPQPAPVVMQPEPTPAPAPVPVSPPMVTTTDTTKTTSKNTQTSGVQATAAEAALVKEQEDQFKKQAELAEKVAEQGRLKAIEEQAKADEKLALTAEKQAKIGEITAVGEETFKTRLAESDRAYEEMRKNSQLKDYWADKSTGDKILAGFAIALGGLGAGMTGDKSNKALDIIQKNIDRDFETQKQNFLNSKDVLAAARDQAQDGRQAVQDQLNLFNLKQAAAYETLSDKYASLAAKRGIPEAQLAQDSILLDLRAKQNQARMEYEKGLRQSVSNSVQNQITTTTNTGVAKPVEGSTPKDAQDEIQGNKDFETWKKRRQAADQFKALRKAGAEGAAVADFIATGLQQGSFSPDMINILTKRNLLDNAGNVLREKIVGGFDPKMVEAMSTGLVAQEAQARMNAAGPIQRAKQLGQQRFGDANYFLGAPEASTQVSAEDQAALQWANANPNDPRAAEIKRSLGK
jgi:hypothetical protein